MATSARQIYVAIDFGTTKSAYAFAVGDDQPMVQPENDGRKVETMLLLHKADNSLHSFGKAAWIAYDDMDEEDREEYHFFDRFKMTLFNDEDVSSDMPIQARCSETTLPAKIVFGRALQFLHQRASERIRQACGPSAWNEDDVIWIITVPAIWGDRAKDFMMEAAKEAGMYKESREKNFLIALEPEAAALCCRDDLLKVPRNQLRHDVIRYMVVDCGGGTIDFTVHDLNVDTKVVDEVYRATGNGWGGTTVNEEIRRFVSDMLGEDAIKEIDEDTWLSFDRVTIEEVKLRFADSLEKVVLTMPTEFQTAVTSVRSFPCGVELRRKKLTLNFDKKVFEKFFQPSTENIADHVRHLMTKVSGIRCIVLVGGYAECPFLFNRLFKEFHNSGCEVIRPRAASSAIVKGAVMFGQNPVSIQTRVAKNTYGLGMSRPFIPGQDPESKKISSGKGDYCNHVFDKMVEIDKPIKIGEVFKTTFCPRYASSVSIDIKIYRVRSPRKSVLYTDDPDCEHLCTVTVPISHMEKGLDRKVSVRVGFSGTHLNFTAIDCESGEALHKEEKF